VRLLILICNELINIDIVRLLAYLVIFWLLRISLDGSHLDEPSLGLRLVIDLDPVAGGDLREVVRRFPYEVIRLRIVF